MKSKKLAAALLIASLPLAPAAFAHERGHDDDDYGRARYQHDYHREHHWRQWHRYDRYERRYDHDRVYGYYGRGWDYRPPVVVPRVVAPQVVLPLPPLPPVPVIVLKKHHAATVELRRPY